jgi:prepilin-type N-terminal cleavage/methylation domain-containing protein
MKVPGQDFRFSCRWISSVDCIAESNKCGRGIGARLLSPNHSRVGRRAFSLIEVMFAMAIVGVLITALYAAIATSTNWVRICQENEVATQIMSEKLDTIRLYNWDQITSNGFIATNFTVGINPMTNANPYYTGRVFIAHSIGTGGYQTNLSRVTVNVSWVSGRRPQSRSMTTFVTTYGLSSYVNK